MNHRDRDFIKLHGEEAWVIISKFKKDGHYRITRQADLLAFIGAKKNIQRSERWLRYWLKLVTFK